MERRSRRRQARTTRTGSSRAARNERRGRERADGGRLAPRPSRRRVPHTESRGALGARPHRVFVPTGTSTRFGGDGSTTGATFTDAEYDFRRIVLDRQHRRPLRARAPAQRPEQRQRPRRRQRVALGGRRVHPAQGRQVPHRRTIFGQTGIESDTHHRRHVLHERRTRPIEWNVEGRMSFGPSDHWWARRGGGSLIDRTATARPTCASSRSSARTSRSSTRTRQSPERKRAMRAEVASASTATTRDHDGIPDDIDACPNDAEDHKRQRSERRLPDAARSRRRRHPGSVRQVPGRARGQGRHRRRRRLPRGRRRQGRHPRRGGRVPEGARASATPIRRRTAARRPSRSKATVVSSSSRCTSRPARRRSFRTASRCSRRSRTS